LLGLVFTPLYYARANFFSSLFTNDVLAGSDQSYVENSQSMSLLKANVSSSVVILDKNRDKKDEIDLNEKIKIVADSALSPSLSIMSTSYDAVSSGEPIYDQVSVYVIRKGDSISQIAEMFNVSVNTILWANDLKKGEKLVEGETLLVLPLSGVNHKVLKGETLKGIAKKYKVEVVDIAVVNGITEDSSLAIGDELIIPNAEIAEEVIQKPKATKVVISAPAKNLGGYFINPVPNYKRRSQGLHGRNSVDLAAPTGTPIVAAASGVVTLARNGYNGGYGNMVVIKHPNGTETLYSHMSKLGTTTGNSVKQGEIIGYVGSTGRSTGPHLHYEVHGARNNALDL